MRWLWVLRMKLFISVVPRIRRPSPLMATGIDTAVEGKVIAAYLYDSACPELASPSKMMKASGSCLARQLIPAATNLPVETAIAGPFDDVAAADTGNDLGIESAGGTIWAFISTSLRAKAGTFCRSATKMRRERRKWPGTTLSPKPVTSFSMRHRENSASFIGSERAASRLRKKGLPRSAPVLRMRVAVVHTSPSPRVAVEQDNAAKPDNNGPGTSYWRHTIAKSPLPPFRMMYSWSGRMTTIHIYFVRQSES